MNILILSFSLATTLAYGSNKCITDGDCQINTETKQGTQCYNVKTGTDVFGNDTCEIRCWSVELGSKCFKPAGKVYGQCYVEETTPKPTFNEDDPNRCKGALSL